MDIIVYTSNEYRLMQRRRFVREEMLAKGKVVPVRPVEEARQWLTFAAEDLAVARLALGPECPIKPVSMPSSASRSVSKPCWYGLDSWCRARTE